MSDGEKTKKLSARKRKHVDVIPEGRVYTTRSSGKGTKCNANSIKTQTELLEIASYSELHSSRKPTGKRQKRTSKKSNGYVEDGGSTDVDMNKRRKISRKNEVSISGESKEQNGTVIEEDKEGIKFECSLDKYMKSECHPTNTVRFNGSTACTGEKYAGAHVSAAGGLENAITDAVSMGAKSFALFLRSQRQWNSKPLEESTVEKFKAACKEHDFPPHLILPHGSYLLNLGSPSEETLQKSRDLLTDELKRCERLGLTLYNLHPGSSCGKIEKQRCIELIAEGINMSHKATKYVKVVLENMSRQGFTIGGDLNELRTIIDLVEDKTRVGVCVDTCHTFAAGYDISTKLGFQAFLDEFEKTIGLQYLVAAHINDSMFDLGCHKDRHDNIGKGKMGKEPFRFLMNSPHFNDIPLILETPYTDGVYKREIKLLNSFKEK